MKFKKYGSTEQKIYTLIKPITDELEYFVWDVSFTKEGALWYLRIFIDRDEGINIQDCENVTRPVNELLDKVDPIEQAYVLEVGSAGLERDLLKPEHFEACIGDEVQVKLIRTIDGIKDFVAVLNSFNEENIEFLFNDGGIKSYPLSEIAHVKLFYDFK